jgi:bacillolysin
MITCIYQYPCSMKRKLYLLAWIAILQSSLLHGQFSALYEAHQLSYDSTGVTFFTPQQLHPGEELGNVQMVLRRTWPDPTMGMDHHRLQQHHLGIPIEGAEYIQHVQDGWLVFANGKFAADMSSLTPTTTPLTEAEAFTALNTHLVGYELAWLYPDWEAMIKEDSQDPEATFKPTGQLIWALQDPTLVAARMDASNFRLAYTYDVVSLYPQLNHRYYIDAMTGELFREVELTCTNGPADLMSYGVRNIDTRWAGAVTRHILHSNDNGRKIHTKYYDPDKDFIDRPEIHDGDDDWDDSYEKATTPHWMVSQAWDMFSGPPYNRAGFDGNQIQVRLEANWEYENSGYRRIGLVDYLSFGSLSDGTYLVSIDICGHEFGHGIDNYTAMLEGASEFGALDEGLGDIYGFLVERYTDGGVVYDWTIGEDAITLRSMSNPNLFDLPDTYMGINWAPTANPSQNNDYGGIHTNCGVMDYWFYLLSQGDTGYNDFGTSYDVNGIGINDAALIAYWTHTNSMVIHSQYADAQALTIAFARAYWGQCSPQHRETQNAWQAVGIGLASSCPITNVVEEESGTMLRLTAHPNPVGDNLTLQLDCRGKYDVEIRNASGQLVFAEQNCLGNTKTISTLSLASGLYMATVKSNGKIATTRFVRQD